MTDIIIIVAAEAGGRGKETNTVCKSLGINYACTFAALKISEFLETPPPMKLFLRTDESKLFREQNKVGQRNVCPPRQH